MSNNNTRQNYGRNQAPPKISVAGTEVVGRRIQVNMSEGNSKKQKSLTWQTGLITQFRALTGEHYFESDDKKMECWLNLSNKHYRWLSDSLRNDMPNPTYSNFPGNIEAIGYKIRIYLNELGKWYVGWVKNYDEEKKMHDVTFVSGETRSFVLRHEAVIWIEKRNSSGKSKNTVKSDTTTAFKNAERTSSVAASPKEIANVNTNKKDNKKFKDDTKSVLKEENAKTPIEDHGDRKQVLKKKIDSNSLNMLDGCRIGLYCSSNDIFYKATIQKYNSRKNKFIVKFDDDDTKEVDLREYEVEWYGPRGKSAGYSPQIKDIMLQYKVLNIPKEVYNLPLGNERENEKMYELKESVGRRVYVFWEADGQYYEAEVLIYCRLRKKHFVVYQDGEVEWIDFKREHVIFSEKKKKELKKFIPGLGFGVQSPRGINAIGWRIAIFWKEDFCFYDGYVKGFDNITQKHKIEYDDGDVEHLNLSNEKIIWKIPPNTNAKDNLLNVKYNHKNKSNAHLNEIHNNANGSSSLNSLNRKTRNNNRSKTSNHEESFNKKSNERFDQSSMDKQDSNLEELLTSPGQVLPCFQAENPTMNNNLDESIESNIDINGESLDHMEISPRKELNNINPVKEHKIEPLVIDTTSTANRAMGRFFPCILDVNDDESTTMKNGDSVTTSDADSIAMNDNESEIESFNQDIQKEQKSQHKKIEKTNKHILFERKAILPKIYGNKHITYKFTAIPKEDKQIKAQNPLKDMQQMLDAVNQNYAVWKSNFDVTANGSYSSSEPIVSKRKNHYPPMILDMPIKLEDSHKTIPTTCGITSTSINTQKTSTSKIPVKKDGPTNTPMITRTKSLKRKSKSLKSDIIPQIHSSEPSGERKIQQTYLNGSTPSPSTTLIDKKKIDANLISSNRKLNSKPRTRITITPPLVNEAPVSSTTTLNISSKQPFFEEAARLQQNHARSNLFKNTEVQRQSTLFCVKEDEKMVVGPESKKICLTTYRDNNESKKEKSSSSSSVINGTHSKETNLKMTISSDNNGTTKLIIDSQHNQKSIKDN